MTETIDQLKVQLGSLPERDRAELAYYLITSLEPVEEGVEEAWRVEVRRRVAEIRSGRAVGIPADELFAELRKEYP